MRHPPSRSTSCRAPSRPAGWARQGLRPSSPPSPMRSLQRPASVYGSSRSTLLNSDPSLGKRAQIDAQFLAVGARQKLLNGGVGLLPYRNSRDEKRPSGRGQFQPSRAFVAIIDSHFYQAASLERFQISRQRRAVHDQQRGYAANGRRLLAIERHQQ